MPDLGDILIAGSLATFAGSVVAFRQPERSTRKRVGDGVAYLGLAIWLGGPLWWLFY
jgi:hypothetical protein